MMYTDAHMNVMQQEISVNNVISELASRDVVCVFLSCLLHQLISILDVLACQVAVVNFNANFVMFSVF